MKVITVRNVNYAHANLRKLLNPGHLDEWRLISPRGNTTLEYREPVVTEYLCPRERVLFDPARDANPFFHLFEALWIAAGRRDVDFLREFLPRIADYSDDDKVFNAAYGYRLRAHHGLDQIRAVAEMLRKDPTTRRAFMIIGDATDLTRNTRDVACNVAVYFKLREGQLHATVSNRSNDAIWGAYGANAVQFSVLLELVAAGCGADVGTYSQVSDSFHVYPDTPKAKTLLTEARSPHWPWVDPYMNEEVRPHALVAPGNTLDAWLIDCERWVETVEQGITIFGGWDPFISDVATPMLEAFRLHRNAGDTAGAIAVLLDSPGGRQKPYVDWIAAGIDWLRRREQP